MLDRRRFLLTATGGAWVVVSGCGGDRTAPPRSSDTVPRPAAMVRTSWSTDPWARGSYSFLPPGGTPTLRAALSTPIDGRLVFAGEACSGAAPSTVHGAIASGTVAADHVRATGRSGERVIVVGAGIAGLTAASALVADGFVVTVVEARDRIGGRLDTVRPDGWAIPVERGASWVHDIAAGDLAERLREAGIDTTPFAYAATVIDATTGERVDPADRLDVIEKAIERALVTADDGDGDVSLRTAIEDSDTAVDRWVEWYLATEISTEYGADADQLSAWYGLDEGSDGDDLLVVGGYGELASRAATGLDVRLSRPVTRIGSTDTGVSVVAGGDALTADRVVVTVPLGVLAAGSIAFDPPLPSAHTDAIERMGMGLLDKFWFRFDEAFWSDDAEMWTRVGGDNPFREWFNLEPATGAPVLLALVGGAAARDLATRADDEVEVLAMASLQEFLTAGR